jgi:hypothetical protein
MESHDSDTEILFTITNDESEFDDFGSVTSMEELEISTDVRDVVK